MDDVLSAQASFDASYLDLTAPTASAYRALGLSPALEFSREFAAAAINTEIEATVRVLEDLVDASLLTDVDGHTFRFHDLVYQHARRTANMHDAAVNRTDTLQRMLQWYLITARTAAKVVLPARRELPSPFTVTSPPFVLPADLEGYDAALMWLDQERGNLAAAVRQAASHGWRDLAVLLADAMQPGVTIHTAYAFTVEIDEIALRAAQGLTDPTAEHSIRARLARAYARLGDLDRARDHAYRSLHDTHLSGDRHAYASALNSHALVSLAAGRGDAAVTAFREVVAIQQELNLHRAEGLTLINLADCLIERGQAHEAINHVDRAWTLLSTLDTPDIFNATRAKISLAQARLHTGDQDVETLVIGALATMTRLDAQDQQARAHDVLAQFAMNKGDLRLAEKHRIAAQALRASPAEA